MIRPDGPCRTGSPTALLLAALLVLMGASDLEGQFRRGRDNPERAGWAPITVGIRGGVDQNGIGGEEIVGLHAHVPVVRNGWLELAPSADVTFLTGAREYQYGLELVYVSGGRSGGLYAGAGIGYRDGIRTSDGESERDWILGYSGVAGLRTGTGGPVQVFIELRWIYLDGSDVRPTPITFGVGIPLWGRSSDDS